MNHEQSQAAREDVEEKADELAKLAKDHEGELGGVLESAAQSAGDLASATAATSGTVREIEDAIDAVDRGDAKDAAGAIVGAIGEPMAVLGEMGEAASRWTDDTTIEQIASVAGTAASVAKALRGPIETLTELIEGEARDLVQYRFESDGLPLARWNVRSLELDEALGEPYRLRVSLQSDDLDLDALALLGRNAHVAIERPPDAVRRVCGVVHRVEEESRSEGDENLGVHVEIVPALALAALRRDSRIFQERTVPEVLEEVLAGALAPYERAVRLELTERYAPREYCVQFGETDLDFVHRLMEEEGITYTMDHEGEVEVMVLHDGSSTFEAVPTLDGDVIPFIPRADIVRAREPVFAFAPVHAMCSTAFEMRDVDWTRQGDMGLSAKAGAADALGRTREVYEHPARVASITGYDQSVAKYQAHDVDRQARIRHELLGRDAHVARGVARGIGFAPGRTFTLAGHPAAGADGEYLITRVVHVRAPVIESAAGEVEDYHNRFECIPLAVPYRPSRRTEKPRIHGMQTAVVVGPGGEEIHTDEHGRVKVQLPWDRAGRGDEKSSCWIRAQQPIAGSGFGSFFLPRVGMQVLVSFLDGDPDRPVVLGSLYDGSNAPPYPLPAEKTKSTIRTQSSPGGGGFNELRFEDFAGREEIYVHAQKDFNEVVLHDHTTSVRHDQSNVVSNDQTQTVGRDQTETVRRHQAMTVEGNRTKAVCGYESTLVRGDRDENVEGAESIVVRRDRSLLVVGNEHREVHADETTVVKGAARATVEGARATVVRKQDVLSVEDDKADAVSGDYTVRVDGGFQLTQGGTERLTLHGRGTWESRDSITLDSQGAVVALDKTGELVLRADDSLVLQCGDSAIELKSDGTIAISGKTIQLKADASTLDLSAAEAKINGPKATLSADGFTTISGMIVKIN